ncbi:hypothetical protein [Streptomyces sp. NPDC059349]|uniref:hypothetical protein n=1 Tax=Streptomyces sp. NPDC059349 TaxID=3346808 RepID=UPI0036AE483A
MTGPLPPHQSVLFPVNGGRAASRSVVLLRLAYLSVTNTFTLLRLLPMSERDKDIEILALRHQLLVLQRQVGRPAFTDTDRPWP